jgi:hypothetical protein
MQISFFATVFRKNCSQPIRIENFFHVSFIFQPTNYTPPAPITMPIFNASSEQQPVQTGNYIPKNNFFNHKKMKYEYSHSRNLNFVM